MKSEKLEKYQKMSIEVLVAKMLDGRERKYLSLIEDILFERLFDMGIMSIKNGVLLIRKKFDA